MILQESCKKCAQILHCCKTYICPFSCMFVAVSCKACKISHFKILHVILAVASVFRCKASILSEGLVVSHN